MDYTIYIDNYASLLESELIPNTDKSYRLQQSNVIVNPSMGSLMNKVVIVNLPVGVPLADLQDSNHIISRFPIEENIDCVPYQDLESRKDCTVDDMSCILLQDFMLTDMKYLDLVSKSNFLLGIGEVIDDHTTLIGMKVLSNKVEDLSR